MRLAEVVASLALATDLAIGQPLEHGLRRTLLAMWLGEELGLDDDDLGTTYYVALLGSVGCVLDGAVFSEFVGDEIAIRAEMATLDQSKQLQVAGFFLRRVGAGDRPHQRLRKLLALSRQQQAVCRDVAVRVGSLLNLGLPIRHALGQCDELWNGKGPALRLKGEEIHVAARMFILCSSVEVHHRIGGPDAAIRVARDGSGVLYDPRMAERFCDVGAALLARLQTVSPWEAVLAAEPAPFRTLSQPEFDEVAHRVATFVDLRSPYTLGHSPAVADLAERTARALSLSPKEAVDLRHAGLLHDLGRAGVPAGAWNKTAPLTEDEWERMKQHPSLSELLLARSNALGHLGTLAGLHHERLDGSGYRGISRAALPVAAQILAAADAYQTKLERRPYRGPNPAEEAALELRGGAARGMFDSDLVETLLEVAGHERPPIVPRGLPAGLTEREAEVLRLVGSGLSNRQIAETLVVSPKTVGRHLESIYSKIDVSTRVGATLFALEHELLPQAAPFAPVPGQATDSSTPAPSLMRDT